MHHRTFFALSSAYVSTRMGKLADSVFRPLVASFSFVLVLLLPADAYEFLRGPQDYIGVHHLDVTQPHWQWQYLQGNVLSFIVAGLLLWLIVASYRQPQKHLLRVSCRVVVTLTIVAWTVNFYQWAMTGFDH